MPLKKSSRKPSKTPEFGGGGDGDNLTPNFAPKVRKRQVLTAQAVLEEANELTDESVKLVQSISGVVTGLMDALYQVQYGTADVSSLSGSLSALSLATKDANNTNAKAAFDFGETFAVVAPKTTTKTNPNPTTTAAAAATTKKPTNRR
ncbi:hypothetical protein TYRP_004147 [Tyrophagus putrescentiae]|nr:hypothetical protein TYRP_004147 [Tyrophagus putrescentiae]